MGAVVILWPDRDSGEDMGGKGNGLRKLIKSGIPVPSFFGLKIEESNGFVMDAKAFEEIRSAVEAIGPAPWAVRSSAIGEDGMTASFAGMFQSYLAISSFESLTNAIIKCFQSLHSDKVRHYCFARNLQPPKVMCVLIQRFIEPQAAGVGFSRNPISPCSKMIWIEGNYGIGTSVVDGSATPDRWIVSSDLAEIKEFCLGSKKVSDASVDGQIKRLINNKGIRSQPCLSDSVIRSIAEQVKNVENILGYPPDVEWVWDGSNVLIVQGRPMTGLSN